MVEDALKALPLWQSLCGEMPESRWAEKFVGERRVSFAAGSGDGLGMFFSFSF